MCRNASNQVWRWQKVKYVDWLMSKDVYCNREHISNRTQWRWSQKVLLRWIDVIKRRGKLPLCFLLLQTTPAFAPLDHNDIRWSSNFPNPELMLSSANSGNPIYDLLHSRWWSITQKIVDGLLEEVSWSAQLRSTMTCTRASFDLNVPEYRCSSVDGM